MKEGKKEKKMAQSESRTNKRYLSEKIDIFSHIVPAKYKEAIS